MDRQVEIYNKILADNADAIMAGGVADRWLANMDKDDRMSITVILRPEKDVADEIADFCRLLGNESHQYYIYPAPALHVTVLDIIPSAPGVCPQDIDITVYSQALAQAVENIPPFDIEFTGITASDNAVIVQGFADSELENVRNNLRSISSYLGLYYKERYKIQTCHITAARLKDRLEKPEKLIEFVNSHRDYHFGRMTVDKIELVWHNRYDTRKTMLFSATLKR